MVSKAEGLFRAVVRNAAVLLGGRTVNAVLGLSALAVAGRALGLHNFGLLVLIHAFAEAVGDVARFQSWQSVLHYGAKPLGEKRIFDFQRIVRFSAMLDVISSFVGVVIGVVGAAFIGPLLGWPDDAAPAAMIYSTSIVFMVTATPTGVLRLFNRFDLIAYQSTIASAVWLIGGALAFIFGLGLKTFLLVWWLGTFAAFVFLFIASWRELRRRGCLEGLTWRMGSLTHGFPGLWRFALTTNATATLELAFNHVSTLFVGALLNPSQAALWRIAKLVADAIAAPVKLVVPALYPELAKLRANGDHQSLARLGLQIGAAGGALAMAILLVTSLAGKPVLSLVMGKVFAPAAGVLTWLVAAEVINMWAVPLEPMLFSTGHATAAFRTRLAVTVLYLIALAPLVHRLGLVGGGAASVVASALMAGGMLAGVVRWYRNPSLGLVGGPIAAQKTPS